ncbi:MAG TPA: hypothetical protein VJS45_01150 [Acidimicrobiia bacterium]|nr:hypothetical protein [Acidimicrobiia bacterium]
MEGREPEEQPQPDNEYAANAESGEEGYRKQGSQNDTAEADLEPHEPPGQG